MNFDKQQSASCYFSSIPSGRIYEYRPTEYHVVEYNFFKIISTYLTFG